MKNTFYTQTRYEILLNNLKFHFRRNPPYHKTRTNRTRNFEEVSETQYKVTHPDSDRVVKTFPMQVTLFLQGKFGFIYAYPFTPLFCLCH